MSLDSSVKGAFVADFRAIGLRAAGHFVRQERPDAVAEAIPEFVET